MKLLGNILWFIFSSELAQYTTYLEEIELQK